MDEEELLGFDAFVILLLLVTAFVLSSDIVLVLVWVELALGVVMALRLMLYWLFCNSCLNSTYRGCSWKTGNMNAF
jgi:hypothetical protein